MWQIIGLELSIEKKAVESIGGWLTRAIAVGSRRIETQKDAGIINRVVWVFIG